METQDENTVIFESNEVTSTLIAKTHHSEIETCEWNGALAVVKKFNRGDNARTFPRWRNEVDALSLVDAHSNITQILASDLENLTITIRYEPGRSLDLYVDSANNSTLSRSQGDAIWKQISGALAHLLSKSIIHDDVKPDNIVFSPSPKPHAVLIDFGAALINPSCLPENGWTPSGTPPYAPPEFFHKRKDYAGDVWGLGVTMLFCFGYIALPDGGWILPHVFENESVKSEMTSWLDGIERLRKRVCNEGMGLLADMLDAEPDRRIEIDELSRRLGAW